MRIDEEPSSFEGRSLNGAGDRAEVTRRQIGPTEEATVLEQRFTNAPVDGDPFATLGADELEFFVHSSWTGEMFGCVEQKLPPRICGH